jgi:hypothetical protein
MKTRQLDTAVQLEPNVQWRPDSWTLQYNKCRMYNEDQSVGHGSTVSAEYTMKTRELDTAVQLVENVQWRPDSWTLQYR